MSPVGSRLEHVCEQWLVDLLGLPKETAAGFTNGTSAALLCCLTAARHALLAGQGWEINKQGLYGVPRIRVLACDHTHATVLRALQVLGLGTDTVERLPTDDQGRILPSSLPELDDRTLLLSQAGDVNSGSFDLFRELGALAQAAGAWMHVDGAFGLWAAASRNTRHLTDGVELAKSWSVDAHKTLNAPYECGIALCRDRDAMVKALQTNAAYIAWGARRDGMAFTLDMSRRARGAELWATLHTLGRSGVRSRRSHARDPAFRRVLVWRIHLEWRARHPREHLLARDDRGRHRQKRRGVCGRAPARCGVVMNTDDARDQRQDAEERHRDGASREERPYTMSSLDRRGRFQRPRNAIFELKRRGAPTAPPRGGRRRDGC